jgi:uncharacterized membrane protein YfcA
MDYILYLFLFILGLIGGFLAGLLGVGGGLIYIIILQYVFKKYIDDTYEITRFILANSIFATIFASISSILRQIKQNTFYGKALLWVGIPSALVSMSISYLIQQGNWYDKQTFLAVFTIMLILTIWKTLHTAKKNQKTQTVQNEVNELIFWKYILTGLLAGIISPLTGLGGGIVIVPVLSNIFKLPVKKAVSISVSSIVVSAFSNTLVYLFAKPEKLSLIYLGNCTGYIVWQVVIPMIIGVVIAAYFGTMVANRIKNHVLQYLFAVFLCIMVIKILLSDFLKLL